MLKDKIKLLATDTLTYGAFQIIGRLFTALLTPIYSNYLTPEENGITAYLFSLLIIAQFFYALGMESAFFRFYEKDNEAQNKKVFTTAFFVIAITSIIFTAFFIIFSQPLSSVIIGNEIHNAAHIFQIVCLIPLFDLLMVPPYGLLRMQRRVKRFATTRLVITFLAVSLNLYFIIFAQMGVLGVFMGQLIASFIGIAIFLPETIKMLDFNINYTLVKDMLKFGLPTVPSNVSAIVLQVADRPIMKLFISNAEIGIYQINAKLAVPMLMLVTVFDYAWRPFFLTYYKEEDAPQLFGRVLTYYILISSFLWLGISLFIDYIVRIPLWGGRYFIHPDYWSGLSVVILIMLGYLINGITTNIASVFHIEKKTKYLPIAVGTSAVISIALNFILIPIIGSIGAAISLLISYSVGVVLMKILQKKVEYKIKYEGKRIAILTVVTFIVLIAGKLITINMDLYSAFGVKIALMFSYLILLRLFGFFTKGELLQLKKIFRKK